MTGRERFKLGERPKPSLFRWILSIAALSASIGLLVWLFDARSLVESLARADWQAILLTLSALFVISWTLRGLRWFVLARVHLADYPPAAAYLDNAVAQTLAEFTPGQSGEAIKVWLTSKRSDGETAGIVGAFFIERSLDILVFASLGAVSLFVSGYRLFELSGQSWAALVGIGLLGFGLASVGGLATRRFWIAPATQVLARIKQIPRHTLGLATVLTIANWLIVVVLWREAFLSVGLEIGLVYTTALLVAATTAGLLSLLPSGIGPADASLLALLTTSGFDPAQALVGTAVIRLLSVHVGVLGGLHALAYWLSRR